MTAALNEKDIAHLDKQTLITLLVAASNNSAMLLENNKSLLSSNELLQKQVDELSQNITLLTEEIRSLKGQRFGRRTEKDIVTDDGCYQLCFAFNEAEITIDLNPQIPEPSMEEVHPKPYKRSRMKGQREEQLKDLPREIVRHDLSEEQLLEYFPDGRWKQLPDQTYERLEFHPASFKVIEHHVSVYAGNGEQKVVRADRPAGLFDKSIATASLLAGIYNYKFANAQPITRLAKEFENRDVRIPTQTMCRWVIDGSDRYLFRIYNRLHEHLYSYHVIHADETPVEVVKDGRLAGSKSYMWVYKSGALESNPAVLYDYQMTRRTDHPRAFLKNYKGFLVTDGYQAYHTIDSERNDLTVAGCWIHARRGFADVVKSSGMSDEAVKDTVAYKALQIIRTISRHESSYREMTPEQRLEERKRTVAPLVDAFFAYLKSREPVVTAKSKTGKAIQYCLNQEKYLRVFLTDGYVPMDNNSAERSIRTFCLGKKNWYTIDTVSGAKASAVVYSIAETAKVNNLKPYEYFKYLLEELPKHGEFEDPSYLDDLLPWSEKLPESCRKPAAAEKT